jgi:hypothetical protein
MILSVCMLCTSPTYFIFLYYSDLTTCRIPHLFPISRISATYPLPEEWQRG